jgi:hypothetical protein
VEALEAHMKEYDDWYIPEVGEPSELALRTRAVLAAAKGEFKT